MVSDERPVSVRGGGYDLKDTSYFAMARDDYVAALPENPEASILEIGCSNGATGALALAEGKCRRYCGVELFPEPALPPANGSPRSWKRCRAGRAAVARRVVRRLDSQRGARAPARSLGRARARAAAAAAGALVFASTPNVAHREIILMLLKGRWELRSYGPLDATHLRWFSPSSLRRAFEEAGFVVDSVGPLGALGPGSAVVDRVLRGRLRHLWHRQIDLRAHVAQAPG